jgi:hypothetical protein
VEAGALVAEALLASAESLEVGGSLGDDVIKQVEVDAASLGYRRLSAFAKTWIVVQRKEAGNWFGQPGDMGEQPRPKQSFKAQVLAQLASSRDRRSRTAARQKVLATYS